MAPTASRSEKHRRFEQLAGVLMALVGLIVAGVAIIALNHPHGRHPANAGAIGGSGVRTSAPPSSTATRSTTSSATATSTKPARPALVVLNNTGQVGLAETAAQRFRAGGWTVTSTLNYQGDIPSSAAYYDPAVAGIKVAAVALQAQFPAIKRVAEKFSGLPPGPIVVVLTSDYS